MDESEKNEGDPKSDSPSGAVHDRVKVSRFFFALPEPLPFPELTEHFEQVGNEPGQHRPDDPWVHLRFHQIEGSDGAEAARIESVFQVVKSTSELGQDAGSPRKSGETQAEASLTTTVVDACTLLASPDMPPPARSGDPQDLSPRSDAFMRCLRLVDDLARAYGIATKVPIGPVTYERVSPLVVFFVGDVPWWLDGGDLHIDLAGATWAGPSLMMLNHLNFVGHAFGPTIVDQVAIETRFWLGELRLGGQMSGWREHLVAARRATELNGDHGAAVILAQTGGEIFLDMLLGILLWEEGVDPAEFAALFAEGRIAHRVKSEFGRRLGGTWGFDGTKPVAMWFHRTMLLRHRVAHGGYRPTRSEAVDAIQSVYNLQTYAFERLCASRDRYPRTTLMTIAQPGLERRGAWAGKIRAFAEQQAPAEPNWRLSFGDWHKRLVEAAAPSA